MQRGGYGGFTDTDGRELQAFRPYAHCRRRKFAGDP
jgi:hypothetical protein